ncbi:MAG: ketoacyl-ACP synthase III, partial [Acidimicrobiales bacterium]|nr:ketoacyl-ACP synthase III [Acidimicrobiales bacterium]
DTSDEWIQQRTGIRERRLCTPERGEGSVTLCTRALENALANAHISASDLDLLIISTVTGDMTCPSVSCRVAANVGAGSAGAFDLAAACSGWVYGANLAHDLIRLGTYNTIAVVGCDIMSSVLDFNDRDRGLSILFGDAAGAAIIRATDDATRGLLASAMHADGERWTSLYIPHKVGDIPAGDETDVPMHRLVMRGREVYKFAVTTFCNLIQQTLDQAGLQASDIDMFICHQSNLRIIESARTRFGIPEDKVYVNIDRVGNSSAGSVPLCLDELRQAGKCGEGDLVMFVAFGGGLTWASALWRM